MKYENTELNWIDIEKVCEISNEEKMKQIYQKLNDKPKQLNI